MSITPDVGFFASKEFKTPLRKAGHFHIDQRGKQNPWSATQGLPFKSYGPMWVLTDAGGTVRNPGKLAPVPVTLIVKEVVLTQALFFQLGDAKSDAWLQDESSRALRDAEDKILQMSLEHTGSTLIVILYGLHCNVTTTNDGDTIYRYSEYLSVIKGGNIEGPAEIKLPAVDPMALIKVQESRKITAPVQKRKKTVKAASEAPVIARRIRW